MGLELRLQEKINQTLEQRVEESVQKTKRKRFDTYSAD